MEDRQLNLNQPLLSVRRNSSISASGKDDNKSKVLSLPQPPRYKPELKSGPVSNPGVVPFFWEQIPGKPKDGMKQQDDDTWERPVPKLPPGRSSLGSQGNSDSVETMKRCGSFRSSRVEEEDENYESADEGEVFLDALDTLSRTESVFLNCSVGGLSGVDEPDGKPSGTFLTDPQTREFMINRFLPAAKAMASEMPQYAPRKQAEVQDQEQPRQQLKKAVMKPDRPPQLQYGRHYYQPHDYEEGSDDEDYDHHNIPARACGILPRFCFRSSFCLLNPVPGMSVRTRAPKPPGSRMQTSGVENKHPMPDASEGKPMVGLRTTEHCESKNDESEKSSNQVPEKRVCKSFRELMAAEDSSVQEDSGNHVTEKTLYVDTVHKLESPVLQSSSPEIKGMPHSSKVDHEILITKREEKPNSVDKEAKIMHIDQENPNFDSLSTPEKLNPNAGRKPWNANEQAQYCYEETLTSVKQDRTVKSGNPHRELILLPVPPPLPKSPSDSWLCRTLPSLSTKSSAFHPKLGTGNPRNQAPKWETIVKTTKWQNQHSRSSEELMAFRPIPEAL